MKNYAGATWSNYAAGDYYQGDYYQPYRAGGFFGKLLGGLKKVAGLVPGPVGALAKLIPSGGGGKSAVQGTALAPAPPPMPMYMDVPRGTPGAVKQPGVRGAIERALPGGQSGYVPGAELGQAAPPGWHWNKSYSYAKGLPKGSFLVRNRSMNPTNPRALRRGVRRQQQFVAIVRRVLKGTGMSIKRSGVGGGRKRARR